MKNKEYPPNCSVDISENCSYRVNGKCYHSAVKGRKDECVTLIRTGTENQQLLAGLSVNFEKFVKTK